VIVGSNANEMTALIVFGTTMVPKTMEDYRKRVETRTPR